MQRQTRDEIDAALMDALASYALALQSLLRSYADSEPCRCPTTCRRCEALALLDGAVPVAAEAERM